jgi:alanine dehydrogenase
MKIGIPRERKTLEKRVALTPEGVRVLSAKGHQIILEKGAGAGSFFEDEEYNAAGCKLVDTLKEVWESSDLVVKVKEPAEEEYQYFRPGLYIFDYLHLAGLPEVTDRMLNSGISGIAYELIKDDEGRLPLLEPMSEIAGKLSVINGACYLFSSNGGRGLLINGAKGVSPAHVVIVGAGIAGVAAAETAIGIGAEVTLLDINQKRLADVKNQLNNERLHLVESNSKTLLENCKAADILIGAVLIPGASAPKIIKKEMISSMKKGSVFVDISIDQGGCAETIRPTNLKEPVYIEHNVIHYGVGNIPALTPRTSTLALTSATLPYIMELAEKGLEWAKVSKTFSNALCVYNGKMVNKQVADSLGIPYETI